MRKLKVAALLFLAGLLSGCVGFRAPGFQDQLVKKKVTLIINSEPPGAKVYQEEKYEGTTPVQISYDLEITARRYGSQYGTKYEVVEGGPLVDDQQSTKPVFFFNEGAGGAWQETKPFTALLDGYVTQTKQYRFNAEEVAYNTEFSMLFVLEPIPGAKPPQQQQQQQQGTTLLKVKVQVATVRAEPDLNAPIIKQIMLDEQLESRQRIGDWYEVIITDEKGIAISGYVNSSLVDVIRPGGAISAGRGQAAGTTLLKVKVPVASVRAEPDLNAPIIKQVMLDEQLESRQRIGEWYEIVIIDEKGTAISGYINSNLVDVIGPGGAISAGAQTPARTLLKVKVPVASVRAEPDLNAPIIKQVMLDEQLESRQRIGEWYEIVIIDEKGTAIPGYINGNLVDVIGPGGAISAGAQTPARTLLKVKVPVASVRAKPDLNAPIIKQVMLDEQLESRQRIGDWYEVIITDERGTVISGYINSNLVDVIGPGGAISVAPAA